MNEDRRQLNVRVAADMLYAALEELIFINLHNNLHNNLLRRDTNRKRFLEAAEAMDKALRGRDL